MPMPTIISSFAQANEELDLDTDEIYQDICAKFKAMLLADPIMVAMNKGEIRWGDLLLSTEEQQFHKEWATTQKPVAPLEQEDNEEEDDWQVVTKQPQKPTAPLLPSIPAGRLTIIARNLPRDITLPQLRTVFEKYGPIKDVYIPKNMDKSSPYFGTIKGFALIKFLKAEHSAAAFSDQYGRLTISAKNIALEFAKEDR